MNQQVSALPLRFVQIGDLHLTAAGLQNHVDFGSIVDELNRNVAGNIDFIYLPGDNADDGTPAQFQLVRQELDRLTPPWHAIPGDHDFKPRSLDNFYAGLGVRKLPYATNIAGCRCIFLDIVSEGMGGPDFKLGATQLRWFYDELAAARREGKPSAVFMHAYPSDLGEQAREIASLIDASSTLLVAMGHTHYNEIANDGWTIYAATRSTGQIEEGPVGFAFAAIDKGVVSWRFKPLATPWPFVMITSPSERRLAIGGSRPTEPGEIRASLWGATGIARAEFRIDSGDWHPMHGGEHGLFASSHGPSRDRFRLEVRVVDQTGASDIDAIEVEPHIPSGAMATGSDAGAIGAWPERHLLGTQLGPNRNGRKW